MTELEVITTAVGSVTVLAAVLGYAAVALGYVEGTLTVRIVPLRKRTAEAPAGAAAGGLAAVEDAGKDAA